MCLFLYAVMPPMAIGVAYRVYWQHGIGPEDITHNIVVALNVILALLSMYCHQRAMSDPGIVKPWHFREYGKIYRVVGMEEYKEEDHGQIKVKPPV